MNILTARFISGRGGGRKKGPPASRCLLASEKRKNAARQVFARGKREVPTRCSSVLTMGNRPFLSSIRKERGRKGGKSDALDNPGRAASTA